MGAVTLGIMPSAAEYVEKFCEVNHLGKVFVEQTLRILARMVTRGVRENDNARLAAIALHLHALQVKELKLTDAIARMAKITPRLLVDLARDARLKMGLPVDKE